ncbi:hypothetical protein JCM8097_006645 [Rhodosporidiobolus ruineniae]
MSTLLSLPPELLQLITDTLYSVVWDPALRRREGLNLALACKALLPYGTALIYRDLSLRGLEHDVLFRRLVERVEVPPLVTSLTYSDSRASPSPTRLALLERLLPACTALQALHVYACPATINRLFGAKGRLLPAATVTSLTLRSVPFLSALDIGPVLSTLSRFTALRHLDLLVSLPLLPSPCPPNPASSLRMPLRTLALSFPPSNASNRHAEYHVLEDLVALFDPSMLKEADLRIATAEPALFAYLSSLSSLTDLKLHLQHDTVDTSLPLLTSTLPSLTSLRYLTLRQRVLRVPRPVPSPSSDLALFLAALPPTLESLNTSRFFPAGWRAAPVSDFLQSRARDGARLRRFVCEVPDEEATSVVAAVPSRTGAVVGRPCEVQRVETGEGRWMWVEVSTSSD